MFCPGKPLLPLFVGETRHFALDMTNWATLLITASSVTVTGACLAAMFVRPRFFCTFCPMLALIHILKPITPLQLRKSPDLCHGCGTCQRVCNMDVERVCTEKTAVDVQTGDCINCGDCVASCCADNALSMKFAGKTVIASSQRLALGIGKDSGRKRRVADAGT
jgi:polyferredoxin